MTAGAGRTGRRTSLTWLWIVLAAAAAIAAPHVFDSLTARHLLVLIAINVILVASLDLLIGGAGLISLGHAAFMGVGAYASALVVKSGAAFPVGLLAAVVIAAAAGLIVGVPALRLKGHYFSVVTFIVGIIITILMTNLVDLTRGPMGLTGIPFATIELFGWSHTFRTIIAKVGYYYLTLVFVALVLLVRWRLGRSRFGRALTAIKSDENLAESVGIATYRTKIAAFVIAAAGAVAAAGSGLIAGEQVNERDAHEMLATHRNLNAAATVTAHPLKTAASASAGVGTSSPPAPVTPVREPAATCKLCRGAPHTSTIQRPALAPSGSVKPPPASFTLTPPPTEPRAGVMLSTSTSGRCEPPGPPQEASRSISSRGRVAPIQSRRPLRGRGALTSGGRIRTPYCGWATYVPAPGYWIV